MAKVELKRNAPHATCLLPWTEAFRRLWVPNIPAFFFRKFLPLFLAA
jgi:hypothetical protein